MLKVSAIGQDTIQETLHRISSTQCSFAEGMMRYLLSLLGIGVIVK